MERTRPHSWLDVSSPFQHAAASHLPDTATPQPTVIVCDAKGTHHQLISRVVSERGARPRWVNNFFAIQQIDSSSISNLAMVGLGTCRSPGDPWLEAIQSLKRKGFNVICYGDGTRVGHWAHDVLSSWRACHTCLIAPQRSLPTSYAAHSHTSSREKRSAGPTRNASEAQCSS
jgi:hypothetical protein